MELSPGFSKKCLGVDLIGVEYLADVRDLHLFRSKPDWRQLGDDGETMNSCIRDYPGFSLLEKNLEVLCIKGTGNRCGKLALFGLA